MSRWSESIRVKAFVPLFLFASSGMLILPKGHYFLAVLFACIGVLIFLQGKARYFSDPNFQKFLLCSVILVLVHGLIMLHHGERFLRFGYLLPFALAPIVLVGMLSSPLSPALFVLGCSLAALFTGIHTLVEVINGGLRAAGSIHNPISFGGSALVLATVSGMACGVNNLCRYYRIFFHVACLFGLIGCIGSGSKGPWLALPIASLFILFFIVKNLESKRRKIVSLTFFISIFVISALVVNLHPRFTSARNALTTIFIVKDNAGIHKSDIPKEGSVIPRVAIWENAISRLTPESLALGKSQAEVASSQVSQYGSHFPGGYPTPAKHHHNDFLEVLSSLGVIGLSALVLYVGVCCKLFVNCSKLSVEWTRWSGLTGLAVIAEVAVFGLSTAWLVNGERMAITSVIILTLMTFCLRKALR